MIEELASAEGLQDLVAAVVDDVVGADRRQRLAVRAESAALEFDDVLLEDDVGGGGNTSAEA